MYNQQYHTFASGASLEEFEAAQRKFLRDFLYCGQNRVNEVDSDQLEIVPEKYPLPVVCILNGCGTSGKDTFASLVRGANPKPTVHLSAITAVQEICKLMVGSSAHAMFPSPIARNHYINEHIDHKSQAYRKLLSQVKAAWNEFNLGPDWFAVNAIERACTNKSKTEMPSIIFLDCREPESIHRIALWLKTSLRLITITLLIDGRVDPSTFGNDSDRNVANYEYTLTIHNNKGLDILRGHARWFADTVNRLNQIHGIPYDNNHIRN